MRLNTRLTGGLRGRVGTEELHGSIVINHFFRSPNCYPNIPANVSFILVSMRPLVVRVVTKPSAAETFHLTFSCQIRAKQITRRNNTNHYSFSLCDNCLAKPNPFCALNPKNISIFL